MSAARKHDTIQLGYPVGEASLNLLKALQQGAQLHWSPTTGYYVMLPNGKQRRVLWFVASALRQAGIIITNDTSWSHARRWHLTSQKHKEQGSW